MQLPTSLGPRSPLEVAGGNQPSLCISKPKPGEGKGKPQDPVAGPPTAANQELEAYGFH